MRRALLLAFTCALTFGCSSNSDPAVRSADASDTAEVARCPHPGSRTFTRGMLPDAEPGTVEDRIAYYESVWGPLDATPADFISADRAMAVASEAGMTSGIDPCWEVWLDYLGPPDDPESDFWTWSVANLETWHEAVSGATTGQHLLGSGRMIVMDATSGAIGSDYTWSLCAGTGCPPGTPPAEPFRRP